MRNRRALCAVLLALVLFLTASVVSVLGFAEEELGFRDRDGTYYPPVGDFPNDRISTVHDDLTLALSVAAGFTITDSHTLRIWNQLVDSEVLPGTPISYTYGNVGFYDPPKSVVACVGENHAKRIWPPEAFDPEMSAVTSRFGPYSSFFHFPHLTGSDLQALRDWGYGHSDTLMGYETYAWGRPTDFTVMQAVEHGGCVITRSVTISMPVPAGSLKAFGTYLHSLGDAYSHVRCLDALVEHEPPAPWGTHTVPALGDPSIYACDYNPINPQNDDAHGREFGSVHADAQRTIDAGRAIYEELSARSISREGVYWPLPLTTTLVVSGTQTTLDQAIVHFTVDGDYYEPMYRRAYVDALMRALEAEQRTATRRLYLPLAMEHPAEG